MQISNSPVAAPIQSMSGTAKSPLQQAVEAYNAFIFVYRNLGSKQAEFHPNNIGIASADASNKLLTLKNITAKLSPADKLRLESHMKIEGSIDSYIAGCANGIQVTLGGRLVKEAGAVRAYNFTGQNLAQINQKISATDTWLYQISVNTAATINTLSKIAPPTYLKSVAGGLTAAIQEKFGSALERAHQKNPAGTKVARVLAYNTDWRLNDTKDSVIPAVRISRIYQDIWRSAVGGGGPINWSLSNLEKLQAPGSKISNGMPIYGLNTDLIVGEQTTDLGKKGNIIYYKGNAEKFYTENGNYVRNVSIYLYQKPFVSLKFLPDVPFKVNGLVPFQV